MHWPLGEFLGLLALGVVLLVALLRALPAQLLLLGEVQVQRQSLVQLTQVLEVGMLERLLSRGTLFRILREQLDDEVQTLVTHVVHEFLEP